MQALAKAAAEGKVWGVSYNASTGRWIVLTLQRWGVKRRKVATCISREEAEAVMEEFFPCLEAAAAEGSFEGQLAAVQADCLNMLYALIDA